MDSDMLTVRLDQVKKNSVANIFALLKAAYDTS